MKTLILAAIRCSLMFTAVTASVFCVQPAQGFTMTLQQVGSNVVANGSGAFNLSGLTGAGNIDGGLSGVRASIGFIGIHPVGGLLPSYVGFTGPTSFGSSEDLFVADASNGNSVAISGLKGILVVPRGYVSGNPLLNSMTFNNTTFANLGVTQENLQASESRIRDVDVAQEMVNFTKLQILSQSGTAMLAQANQAPQGVLSLLR